jgi:hypothetical protein
MPHVFRLRKLCFGPLLAAVAVAICWACRGHNARGDTLELTNGGRIEGRLVNPEDGQSDYVIETATGRLTFARSQVARVDVSSAAEKQYETLARTSPDTVEAHWKLYEWCRDQKLRGPAQKHLTRILELDPDHAQARSILGFKKEGGQWQTRDQLMASRGMVKYEGEYYTRQHVELLQRQKEAKSAQVDWRKDLQQLRRWLTGSDQARAQQALAKIPTIQDPAAAEPMVAMFRKETEPKLQSLWLEVLARLNDQVAVNALIEHSLYDDNDEIRYQCLEYLIKSGRPGLAAPYLQALKSNDNVTINRAAMALGRIGDPEAIGPLIDVLVTNHKVKVSDNSGKMAAGPGSLSIGGGPKFENRQARNADVLAALVALTGMAQFEYDQPAWRAWLTEQAKQHPVDLRRDQ